MKKLLYITGIILTGAINAQQPFINGLNKTSGTATEVVTILGSGFSDNPTVYFGNGKVTTIVRSSANAIEVRVPATATHGPVVVVNTNTKMAASSKLFTLSFDADAKAVNTFTHDPIYTRPLTIEQPYDLCLCDFDDNGRLDIAITAGLSDEIILVQNTSTPSSTNFTHSPLSSAPMHSNRTNNIDCGDLNGDGLPDLVASSLTAGEPFIHIFQNAGAGSFNFTTAKKIILPQFQGSNRQGKKVRITDIDGDGKPDIVLGNLSTSDNNILIYLNTSAGSVRFAQTPITVTVAGADNTGTLDIGDFNNDNKPDIVVIPFRKNDRVYVLKNKSVPGNVSFELKATFGSRTERVNAEIGDVNNDGLNDIFTSSTSGVEVFENVDGKFNFRSESMKTDPLITSWGLDLGDINGDGLLDIAVASLQGHIVYYKNTTSTTGIDFSLANMIATDGPARNVRLGDLNNDGKPDIVLADNSKSNSTGAFSVIINRNQMTPVITPSAGTYCNGGDFILRATGGEGVTYSWNIRGDTPTNPMETTNELNISSYTENLTVKVTAIPPDGMGRKVSNATDYSVGGGSVPSTPVFNDPGLICGGTPLTLTSSTTGLAEYIWSGPNDFHRSTTTPNVLVTNTPTVIHSGTYTLVVKNGVCPSTEVTRAITISSPPVVPIEVADCGNNSTTLKVPDFGPHIQRYQWKLNTKDVGVNSPTYTATTSGSYALEITDDNSCTTTSEVVVIPNAPVSSYTNPNFGMKETSRICMGVPVSFTANSTGTPNLTLGYIWEVEDPMGRMNTTTGNSLAFTFPTLGDWKVRLMTEYTNSFGCNTIEKTITVVEDPAFIITSSAMTKCSNDAVTLTLNRASTANGDSWTWSDSNNPVNDLSLSANRDLVTSIAGTYTATYTSGAGCQATTAAVTIEDFPGISVTATESTIENDTLIFAEEQTSVTLTATNSLGFEWSISSQAEDLDNANTATVVVTPSVPIITVTVSGMTPSASGSCMESTNVVIISGSLIARKSFSPNGDALNDFWSIKNSRNLEGCKVFIFDQRGFTLFQKDSPFTNDEIWDGNYKGKPAPEDVYYFVLTCDDPTDNQTGAILLAR